VRTVRLDAIVGVVLAAGIALVVFGQYGFRSGEPSTWSTLLWAAGLALTAGALFAIDRAVPSWDSATPSMDAPARGWTALRTLLPLWVCICATFVAWRVQLRRADDAARWDLLWIW
jgi:hypothetical protein